MRSKTTFVLLALLMVALALGGCGGTKKAASSAVSNSSVGGTTARAAQPLKTLTYSLRLAGVHGTASGSALASVSVHSASRELCWKFSGPGHQYISRSAARPSIAIIQRTPAGTTATPGVLLGLSYKRSGCMREPPGFLERLESHPPMYYLSVYNTQSGGVVRGQL
jgi:hypothetical protein